MVEKSYTDQSVAIMQSEFGIEDEEVLLAIKNHTTGRKEMTKTENLYSFDYIEPGRKPQELKK